MTRKKKPGVGYRDHLNADKQITMEEHIAARIFARRGEEGEPDEETCARLGRDILLMVLHEFRPDMVTRPRSPEPKGKRPRSYHFDVGNSTDGPVGFCAEVTATSKRQAVEILRQTLPESVDVPTTRIEYLNIYLNPKAVAIDDIDMVDEEDQK